MPAPARTASNEVGSQRLWLHRSGRAVPASSGRGRASGTRVGPPQREIMTARPLAVTWGSVSWPRVRWSQAMPGFSATTGLGVIHTVPSAPGSPRRLLEHDTARLDRKVHPTRDARPVPADTRRQGRPRQVSQRPAAPPDPAPDRAATAPDITTGRTVQDATAPNRTCRQRSDPTRRPWGGTGPTRTRRSPRQPGHRGAPNRVCRAVRHSRA